MWVVRTVLVTTHTPPSGFFEVCVWGLGLFVVFGGFFTETEKREFFILLLGGVMLFFFFL